MTKRKMSIKEKELVNTRKELVVDLSLPKIKISNEINEPGSYWTFGCSHSPFENKKFFDSVLNFINKEINLKGII